MVADTWGVNTWHLFRPSTINRIFVFRTEGPAGEARPELRVSRHQHVSCDHVHLAAQGIDQAKRNLIQDTEVTRPWATKPGRHSQSMKGHEMGRGLTNIGVHV